MQPPFFLARDPITVPVGGGGCLMGIIFAVKLMHYAPPPPPQVVLEAHDLIFSFKVS